MTIEPHETKIVGQWKLEGNHMIADDRAERIDRLTQQYLIKVGTTSSGWDALYQDPKDKRYWERIYPHGEMHGGGPPSLFMLSDAEARNKYKI